MNSELTETLELLPRSRYGTTSDEQRQTLIRMVMTDNIQVSIASRKLGLKYSTAKSIITLFQTTGRVSKRYCNDGQPSAKKKLKLI